MLHLGLFISDLNHQRKWRDILLVIIQLLKCAQTLNAHSYPFIVHEIKWNANSRFLKYIRGSLQWEVSLRFVLESSVWGPGQDRFPSFQWDFHYVI